MSISFSYLFSSSRTPDGGPSTGPRRGGSPTPTASPRKYRASRPSDAPAPAPARADRDPGERHPDRLRRARRPRERSIPACGPGPCRADRVAQDLRGPLRLAAAAAAALEGRGLRGQRRAPPPPPPPHLRPCPAGPAAPAPAVVPWPPLPARRTRPATALLPPTGAWTGVTGPGGDPRPRRRQRVGGAHSRCARRAWSQICSFDGGDPENGIPWVTGV